MGIEGNTSHHEPWNKGKLVGQKAPFKLKDIWALRVRLQLEDRVREAGLLCLDQCEELTGSVLRGYALDPVSPIAS